MNLGRRLRGVHSDESGAIAMLAFVGLLITFMTALILYDAGFAVRHKFKAQISADAAAYSQASVKARVMNTVAYMNVVKRTMAATWSMYVGMMYQFWREAHGSALCAFDATGDYGFASFLYGVSNAAETKQLLEYHEAELETACPGAVEQFSYYARENYSDWWHFANTNTSNASPSNDAPFTSGFGSYNAEYYRKNLERLNEMQEQLLGAAPRWSAVEGAVRGRASGAEKIDTYPGSMPTRKGVDLQVCLNGTGHIAGPAATGPELMADINANRKSQENRSEEPSQFVENYRTANLDAGMAYMGTKGCTSLTTNVGDAIAPFIPTSAESQDYVHTGRNTPFEQYRSDHFLFLTRERDLGHPEVEEYEGVSCGQIADLAPEYAGFRASWAPRVAPVERCDPGKAGWWK